MNAERSDDSNVKGDAGPTREPIDRRALLQRLSALGLAHFTVLGVGGAARAQGGAGGTGLPPPTWRTRVVPGGGGSGGTSGTPPVGGPGGGGGGAGGGQGGSGLAPAPPQPGCNQRLPSGMLVGDATCGMMHGNAGYTNEDRSCGQPIWLDSPHRMQDLDCGNVAQGSGYWSDQDCGMLRSPQGPSFYQDEMCGFQPGSDVDCGLPWTPTSTPHTDNTP